MKQIDLHINALKKTNHSEITDFYNEATQDYKFWSNDYNMHFGYYIPFKTNTFKRDSMLNEMNNQILKKLNLSETKKTTLADLGCGMGGSMRFMLKMNKNLSAVGITLSEFQVMHGNELLHDLNGIIIKENYNTTSFISKTFDAAIAVESFCHSGHNKKTITEAFRILKPNGTLVIADAFLKKNPNNLCHGSKYAYERLCSHWSLEKLEVVDKMIEHLKMEGFSKIHVEDASLRVAPSVLHVPFAILGFIAKQVWNRKGLKKESLHNLKGSFYALLSGLHLKSFGYFIITCKK